MPELTLIFFKGCPNADRARALLTTAGRHFAEVRQDELPTGHAHKRYTSPTILLGERVLYGSEAGEAGCSIASWDEAAILAEIQANPDETH